MGLGLIMSSLSKHANHANNPGTLLLLLCIGGTLINSSMAYRKRVLRWLQQNGNHYRFFGCV
jgi:hypothetical protein